MRDRQVILDELLTTIRKWRLELKFNPNHVAHGENGGQFTSGTSEEDDFSYIEGFNKAETGKPVNVKAFRFESEIGGEKIKFYSKNKDYAEMYALTMGADVSRVKEYDVSIKNPLVIDVPNKLFSSPTYEKPIINRVIKSSYDGIVFKNQEDAFYVTIKK